MLFIRTVSPPIAIAVHNHFSKGEKRDNEMKETILGERWAGAMQVRKKVPIVERGIEEGGEFLLFPEGE